MLFCPQCKSLLKPIEKGGQRVIGCSCGYVAEKGQTITIKEKCKKDEGITVIDKEVETKPLVDTHCPKCGHKRAYFWSIQTRASDEPETRFFKCEKCQHTWREYK